MSKVFQTTQNDKNRPKVLDSKKVIDDELRDEEFQKKFKLMGETVIDGICLIKFGMTNW